MRVRDIVTAAVSVAWMATAHTSTISARSPQRGTLPAGEGRDTAIRICGDCHEAEQMSNAYRAPVEWETLIEDMAKNLKPAKALGITIPESILLRAVR